MQVHGMLIEEIKVSLSNNKKCFHDFNFSVVLIPARKLLNYRDYFLSI
jgi:hypothetical protein